MQFYNQLTTVKLFGQQHATWSYVTSYKPYEKRSRCQVGTADVQVEGSHYVQRRITQRLLATRIWLLFVLSHICWSGTDPFALALARCSHILTYLVVCQYRDLCENSGVK